MSRSRKNGRRKQKRLAKAKSAAKLLGASLPWATVWMVHSDGSTDRYPELSAVDAAKFVSSGHPHTWLTFPIDFPAAPPKEPWDATKESIERDQRNLTHLWNKEKP